MSTLHTDTNKRCHSGHMIVGLDGSDGSRVALQWALAHLDQFGTIQPVIGWRTPWWVSAPQSPGGPLPPPRDYFRTQAHDMALTETAAIPVDDQVPPIVTSGHTGRTLCAAAKPGDVIVVGSRGRGTVAETITGSTGSYCAAHSTVPVVIVPPAATPHHAATHLVVGVDGSDNGIAALTWAIDHCPDGAKVEALHAYVPAAAMFELAESYGDIFERNAQNVLDRSLAAAVEASTRPSDEYELVSSIVLADARSALRERGANTIVVGARGHRGVAHLLLGSVASALTHHTSTTTVIVPTDA